MTEETLGHISQMARFPNGWETLTVMLTLTRDVAFSVTYLGRDR